MLVGGGGVCLYALRIVAMVKILHLISMNYYYDIGSFGTKYLL